LLKDESQAEDVKAQNDTKSNISECELDFSFEVTKENIHECLEEHQQVQNDLSKIIVRPWEELQFNKNQHGLGYEKDISFHIPNYSKPIQFVSVSYKSRWLSISCYK
jgi:hypothetical protein